MLERKVNFIREPIKEAHGTVAIFEDLYGKNWRIPDKKYYWEKNKNKTILN